MEEKLDDPVFSDIRREWHWVKPGIEAILAEDKFLSFRPEDVYAACIAQEAHLWTTDDGFVVTIGETDPFSGERALLVWLAAANRQGQGLVNAHEGFFMRVAREAGFSKLTVKSSIPKMSNYLTEMGWDIETIVYSKDLADGLRTKETRLRGLRSGEGFSVSSDGGVPVLQTAL
jgi:hypothetical protein